MSVDDELSLGELNSIMNLQRQEAFDDNTEVLHKSMSRRGMLVARNSGSNKLPPASQSQNDNAEEQLLKIINSQNPNASKQNSQRSSTPNNQRRSRSRSRSRPRQKEESSSMIPESSKKRPSSSARRSSSRQSSRAQSDSSANNFHSSMGNLGETNSSRPPYRQRRSSSKTRSRRDLYARSQSVGNMNLDPKAERTRSSAHSSSQRQRRRSRSPSQNDGASISSSSDVRRRRSATRRQPLDGYGDSIPEGSKNGETGSGENDEKSKPSRVSMSEQQRRPSRRVMDRSSSVGDINLMEEVGTFDQLWDDEGRSTKPSGSSGTSRRIPRAPESSGGSVKSGTFKDKLADLPGGSKGSVEGDARSQGTKDTLSTMGGDINGKVKKTKLEKIHELQAKCDRYKKEWLETTKDKKQLRNEVQKGKAEVLSLTKEIDAHKAETTYLQKKLSETMEKMDEVQDEQRKERNDFSTTAKELAQSRIEFTKALNDTRELRTELDKLEETLREKDSRITELENDLNESKGRAEDLDSDLNFAEDTVFKLEQEIKRLEQELMEYKAMVEKEGDNADGEGMRKAREDMENRLFEDRERRLEEKQQKLEEKIQQFEQDRESFKEKEKEREEEIAERVRVESETSKSREEERTRLDDDIEGRLKALESDNTALQGRLKSEQLDSSHKLKQKDERIDSLQRELTTVQNQLAELGSDPNGATALKKEVEAAKTETETLRDELEEVQKHNGMLTDEIEELQVGAKELQAQTSELQKEVTTQKNQAEMWQRKASEWEAKSGEWTDKAHLWKEKAEQWEKIAKEADPAAPEEPEAAADPQALFLQAALERKKAVQSTQQTQHSKWGVISNFLAARTCSEESSGEAQQRVKDLEAENAKQAEIIKNLRSEMMRMQGQYKEQAYNDQQKLQELLKEKDEVQLKNTNLMKELELARRLESFASQDAM